MDPEAQSHTKKGLCDRVCPVLVLLISLSPIIGFYLCLRPKPFTDLTFTVESTAVKPYNLTTTDHDHGRRHPWAIDLNIRAHNSWNYTSMDLYGFNMEVRKGGSRHKVAAVKDKGLGGFSLCPGCQSLIHVGVDGHVADREVAAGEGRFDVVMDGDCHVWRLHDYGLGYIAVTVTCENVVLDFARSSERVQKVVCKVMR